jgi:PAS domain S-box-containing protein
VTAPASSSSDDLDIANLLGHLPGMVYRCVNDGRWTMTYVSEGCVALTGYTRDELVGDGAVSYGSLIHPDDRAAIEARVAAAIAARSSFVNVYRIYNRQGEVRWVSERASGLYANDGRLQSVEGFTTDITTQILAAQETEKNEQLFRSIVEDSPIPYAIHDAEQRVRYLNPQFVRTYGYTVEDLPNLAAWAATVFPDPAYREWIKEQWVLRLSQARNANGTVAPLEVRIRSKDGSMRTAMVYAHSRLTGPETTYLVVLLDITQMKEMEAERARLRHQLLQSQKLESIGRLAGGVAHDFNNMLGVILGHTELALQQSEAQGALRLDLQEIRDAAQRSAALTRQLLAFARRQPAQQRAVDLNPLLRASLSLLRRLIGEDIELVFEPAPDLWPVLLDPAQLDQVVTNLCVNARDAIDGVGRITIATRNHQIVGLDLAYDELIAPGDYAVLEVRDTGHGIDSATKERIFEPFFTTRSEGGTGLGLATVQGIVTQNDGHVEVESEPGQGACFRIYLPRHAVGPQPAEPEAERDATPGSLAHHTVLLVEDEPAMLTLTATLLQQLGHTVLRASDPDAALRVARDHVGQIDLLMTDVIMPHMNGRDLALRLARLRPGVRLLFVSGYTADVIAERGLLLPGVQFIEKPFTLEQLREKLQQALGPRG